jgi:hypothetical protein
VHAPHWPSPKHTGSGSAHAAYDVHIPPTHCSRSPVGGAAQRTAPSAHTNASIGASGGGATSMAACASSGTGASTPTR